MKPTVLIVDDDTKFLTFVGHKLKRGGYRVLSANDGCEVPELLARTHVDVLVLDLQMPGMNGWELIRHLADRSVFPNTRPKIVVISGRDEAETQAFVRRLGADVFLTKPLWGEQILSALAQVLHP